MFPTCGLVAMNPNLFVYGTLKSTYQGTFGRPMRDRLHKECKRLGPATVPGRLFDLGAYPGLAEPMSGADVVQGELLQLTDPEPTFIWLDAYEGILPGALAASEYRREERVVELRAETSPRPHKAWVYLYARQVGDLRLVPSGLWNG